MITIIHASNIDRKKWDARIKSDPDFKVYALAWFLDALTDKDWSGLIDGDYETIMPFVTKRKFGISYAYMPYLAQQFSVYGDKCKTIDFISRLRLAISFAEIKIRYDESIFSEKTIEAKERSNYVLSLNKTYQDLYRAYSNNHRRNITKYNEASVDIISSNEIEPLLILLRKEMIGVLSSAEMDQIIIELKSVYKYAIENGTGKILYSNTVDGIIGGAFFLFIGSRIYYLIGSARKREIHYHGVLFGLIDSIIKENASSSLVLDFEGSDIPGIARFFEGFGAINEKYLTIKWNDLPLFIKWIKR